jgi:ketosteroid isomerase-like protein
MKALAFPFQGASRFCGPSNTRAAQSEEWLKKASRMPIYRGRGVHPMKKISLLMVVMAVGSLSLTGQDNWDVGAGSRILALENVWNQAVEHRDTKALDAMFDNSLVYIEHDGQIMTKAEYLASVKGTNSNPEQVLTEEMRAQVYGNTVVVTGIYKEKGVRNGKPYQRRGRFIDTWVFKERTWVCVAAQATLISH